MKILLLFCLHIALKACLGKMSIIEPFDEDVPDPNKNNPLICSWSHQENEFRQVLDGWKVSVIKTTESRRCWGLFDWDIQTRPAVEETLKISESEVASVVRQNIHPTYGQLSPIGKGWATANKLVKAEPSCWHYHTWYASSTINVYKLPIKVEISHSGEMTASGGSMSSCDDPTRGTCITPSGESFYWTPKTGMMRAWVPWVVCIGYRSGKEVFMPDCQLAVLTKEEATPQIAKASVSAEFDWSVKPWPKVIWKDTMQDLKTETESMTYYMTETEQGLYITGINVVDHHKAELFKRYKEFTGADKIESDVKRMTRRRRSAIPTTSSTAAVLTAFSHLSNIQFKAYAQMLAWQRCKRLEETSRLILAASSDPTSAILLMRTVTGDQNIDVSLSGSHLIVTKCYPVQSFVFEAMNTTCTKEVPLRFQFGEELKHGQVLPTKVIGRGFVDPLTRIITHKPQPVDCALAGEVIAVFDKPYMIHGPTGMVKEVNFQKMHLFNDEFGKEVKLKTISIHPTIGIDFAKFQSGIRVADLNKFTESQYLTHRELAEKLGLDPDTDSRKVQSFLTSQSVLDMLFSFVPGFEGTLAKVLLWPIIIGVWLKIGVQLFGGVMLDNMIAKWGGFCRGYTAKRASKEENRRKRRDMRDSDIPLRNIAGDDNDFNML